LKVGITIAMFAILCVITYVFFIFGERFVNYIGTSALNVITRMMGLILAVIGTQMVIAGIQGTF
ncbi:MAG: MarC family protein, partial [Deltaproteobacteria bacterium]|nr:MarC family protein [Deltaproteobacteria bacterium]